ncbi:quinone oxidoreductase family protein [Sphingomonas sp.]|uniref:quinone oxidoreductase family protein n=1 Tax=Sphingomonas sp. TaxID=28214 RepID=UPI003B3AE8B3
MSEDYRIILRRTGGPEVLEREKIDPPQPAPDEVVVRHSAIGLNFVDTYHRSGLYPTTLPSGLGTEAAGVIEAVGENIDGFAPGDRVAYAGGPLGAYATVRAIPAHLLIRLPDGVDDRTAAASLVKGLTADMLVGPCAKVQAGQTVLVHSAAGGVGSFLVPWLKAIGARVVAHAGSAEKAARAKAAGADHALSCPFDTLAQEVRTITEGAGVHVVFDGVGQASWDASVGALAKRGLMVSFGNASGPVAPVAPLALARAGSLFLTRPTLFDYIAAPEERDAATGRLFAMLRSGTITADIGQTFPLSAAADAHRALETRATTGSTLLIP